MAYTEHYLKIYHFLSEHQAIWQDEVLTLYPRRLYPKAQEWSEVLTPLSDESLWKMCTGADLSPLLGASLYDVFKESFELQSMALQSTNKTNLDGISFSDSAFYHMRPKKRHEIERLAPFFKECQEHLGTTQLVDIGGGLGHLSRFAATYFGYEAYCLDADEALIKTAQERLEKNKKLKKPTNHPALQFIKMHFPPKDLSHEKTQLKEILKKPTLLTGLHTCGPLAVEHLKIAVEFKAKALLNFGCCYHKIEDIKSNTNLSELAKKWPISWNNFALTLATRSHAPFRFEQFATHKQVKFHRYALHLLLDHLGQKEFIPVGEAANKKIYFGQFGDYAILKLQELAPLLLTKGLFIQIPSQKECQDFFENKETQKKLQEMFCLSVIRWRFGRLLEISLLLDRALWLKEYGLTTYLKTFFNEEISPRNIGLFAFLKN